MAEKIIGRIQDAHGTITVVIATAGLLYVCNKDYERSIIIELLPEDEIEKQFHEIERFTKTYFGADARATRLKGDDAISLRIVSQIMDHTKAMHFLEQLQAHMMSARIGIAGGGIHTQVM